MRGRQTATKPPYSDRQSRAQSPAETVMEIEMNRAPEPHRHFLDRADQTRQRERMSSVCLEVCQPRSAVRMWKTWLD